MITFNEKDFHMLEIKAASGLEKQQTKKHYRIHGIKNCSNTYISIKYNEYHLSATKLVNIRQILCSKLPKQMSDAILFDQHYTRQKITIGLHKKIRENTKLSVAILKTIIFLIEGRLKEMN